MQLDHGFLILNKPKGITSRQLVNQINRQTPLKVGHTGTLDPLASGMMILCIGDATRFSQFVITSDKAYEADIAFGQQTQTDDCEGEVILESHQLITEKDITHTLPNFTGIISQTPPLHSAIHINGQRAYKLARKNIDFQIPSRDVHIHTIKLLAFDQDTQQAKLYIHCQSGTYIRSIARDLGKTLGCYAHLKELKRLWITPFQETDLPKDHNDSSLITLDTFFKHHSPFPTHELNTEDAQSLIHGRHIKINADTKLSAYYNGSFIGIITPADQGEYKVFKLRSNPEKNL